MTRVAAIVVTVFACLAASAEFAPAVACLQPDAGTGMRPAKASLAAAALRVRPSPVKVGAPFVVELRVCSLDGKPIQRLTIDATMPAHRHGMNYKPEIVDLGEGRYEAKGFLFQMPGRWEISLSVYSGQQPSHLTLDLDVK